MLEQLRDLITRHAHADLRTPVPGLLLSKVETSEPHHSLAEPLLVVMAQGGKRLLLGDHVHEYRAGQYLLVGTDLPVTGHFVGATPRTPALGLGLALRPTAIAPLLLEAPPRTPPASPIAIDDAGPELLDAALRLLRLLDHPSDAPVLAPLIEREILWRLLTGPHGGLVRRIGLADSGAAHVGRAIRWIRANYAEPTRIEELARLSGLSASAFHRQFRAVTAMSPLQFQKRIRLQEARSLLLADAGDVAGVGHLVGYDSPSQFNREYRRLFGAPPGQDAARLREAPSVGPRLP
ncbi:AraC family transcriptional regulator [Amycolatopsis mediterranei]|uniref:AraC family transcriptional regulator n=1 Tax=Amycolatopsis mediterranei TaxID=33910 RepID=UPI0034368A0D